MTKILAMGMFGDLVSRALADLEGKPEWRLLRAAARVHLETIHDEAMRAVGVAMHDHRRGTNQVRFSEIVRAVTKAAYMRRVLPGGTSDSELWPVADTPGTA